MPAKLGGLLQLCQLETAGIELERQGLRESADRGQPERLVCPACATGCAMLPVATQNAMSAR